MKSTSSYVRWLLAAGFLVSLSVALVAVAGAQGPPGYGKDDKKVIEIDLSKLPPDLARQLQKHLEGEAKKGPPKGVPPAGAEKKEPEKDAGLRPRCRRTPPRARSWPTTFRPSAPRAWKGKPWRRPSTRSGSASG